MVPSQKPVVWKRWTLIAAAIVVVLVALAGLASVWLVNLNGHDQWLTIGPSRGDQAGVEFKATPLPVTRDDLSPRFVPYFERAAGGQRAYVTEPGEVDALQRDLDRAAVADGGRTYAGTPYFGEIPYEGVRLSVTLGSE